MHTRKRGVCLVVECYISRSKFAIFCGRMNSLHCHKNDSPENEKAAEVCSTDATEVASLTHPGLLLQHHKLLCNPNRKCKFRNKKQQRCCTFLTALFCIWKLASDVGLLLLPLVKVQVEGGLGITYPKIASNLDIPLAFL